ncbi:hypothetical protein FNV43_RR15398 [Rhamnella rubrinervis]|uniref:RRM domain-containing protein n=1 Tax=Rhamnella rubrinervis TaxID=2594499 RepID=A0A8K0E8T7_9ROSA|nr:hypothetical protein FNV43_RR15398 [Rhamnella rubrinervis]
MEEDIVKTKMMPLRIYVGGLGETVAESEVSRIFESVGGVVEGVDLVRTKGRSFAYVDFLPSSEKSMSKLFGTYNGCLWKGGRLKLEKAKEHYLLRLREEWAEDAAQVATADTSEIPKNLLPSEKPKNLLYLEKKQQQLQIFFPRLRKVKKIPFGGTGKHKYSFQRVEVPPLPVHFCACEEHSLPSHTEIEKRNCGLEKQSGGMNKEEINIMNEVMNKLFEKKSSSILVHDKTTLSNNENSSAKSIDDMRLDDDETDEDNLIINVVGKGKKTEALFRSQEDQKVSENQTWVPRSKDGGPSNDVSALQKQNNYELPSKKRKTLVNVEGSGNQFDSAISGAKEISRTCSNNSAQPADPELVIPQSTARVSWSQKSSWKALVGDRGNNAFSISRIVPGIASTMEDQNRYDAPNVPKSDSKNQNLESDEELNSDSESQNSESDQELNSDIESQNSESGEELNSDGKSQNSESGEELNSDGEIQNSESDAELNSDSKSQNSESEEEFNPDNKSQNSESEEELNSDSKSQNSESDEELNSDSKSQNSERDKELNSDGKNQNLKRDEELEGPLQKMKDGEVLEAQPTEPNVVSTRSGRGVSWRKKSSWTQLVSETPNSSFSISQLLTGTNFERQTQVEPKGVEVPSSNDDKLNKIVKQDRNFAQDDSTASGIGKEGDVSLSPPKENQRTLVANNQSLGLVLREKRGLAQKQTAAGSVEMGQGCSFVRNANSLKEWAKTKASLNLSLKRKTTEK